MSNVICPHTVSDIPNLSGGYLKPSDCVLLHMTPKFKPGSAKPNKEVSK